MVRLLLLLLCLGTHCRGGKPTQWGNGYSGGKGSSASGRWGHWNQRQESWGSRGFGDRELVVRVKNGDRSKSEKKKSKSDKKKRQKSSSSESSDSTSSSSVPTRKKQKKSRRDKKREAKSTVSPSLTAADCEELQAFRRSPIAWLDLAVVMVLGSGAWQRSPTPKTKKLIQAQALVAVWPTISSGVQPRQTHASVAQAGRCRAKSRTLGQSGNAMPRPKMFVHHEA